MCENVNPNRRTYTRAHITHANTQTHESFIKMLAHSFTHSNTNTPTHFAHVQTHTHTCENTHVHIHVHT